MLLLPGTRLAWTMLRSSLKSCYHFLIIARLRSQNSSNDALTRSSRCGGSSTAPRMVSIIITSPGRFAGLEWAEDVVQSRASTNIRRTS